MGKKLLSEVEGTTTGGSKLNFAFWGRGFSSIPMTWDINFHMFQCKIRAPHDFFYMAVCQNLVPLVNIKIAGKWMFIPLKMVLIGINPYPH